MNYFVKTPALLVLLFPLLSTAQNLVLNGGFEAHQPLQCHTCYQGSEDFKKLTHGWDDLNTNPTSSATPVIPKNRAPSIACACWIAAVRVAGRP